MPLELLLQEREADPPIWPEPVVRTRGGTQDLDLLRVREFNGLALHWPGQVRRVSYDVLASEDARQWKVLSRVRRSSGSFDALYLPESEARHLQIRALDAPAPLSVELRDSKQWPDLNAVLSELARHAPRGHVPRAFLGEQSYWALVGVDGGGERSALLSEDGALRLSYNGFGEFHALVGPSVPEGERSATLEFEALGRRRGRLVLDRGDTGGWGERRRSLPPRSPISGSTAARPGRTGNCS